MHKLSCSIVLTAAMLAAFSRPASAGELRLSIANGRVTLVAHDVSVRQILDEWARIGQTRIVNADKLMGPPVTLELTDVPEGKALDTVLRSVSGYVLAARSAGSGPSVYDRIMILPTSRPPATSPAPPAPFRPSVPQPMPAMPPMIDDDEEPRTEGVLPPGMVPPPGTMQPGATPFPGQGMTPQPGMQPPQPGQQGQAPITAPRPGMLPPAPNVPGNPYQPQPQTVRPPGGGPGGPGGA
jgi:hypothetical protein